MSDSLRPHGLQHARPPCPSPTPWVYSNTCASSWWCHPTISSPVVPFSACLQSFPAIGVFSNESALRIRWPKYWSFSFNISAPNEHSGLISFRIHWLDLLAVPGTFKSLLQHYSSKASILWPSAFFIVQLSHPYMTKEYWDNNVALFQVYTWKTKIIDIKCCIQYASKFGKSSSGPRTGKGQFSF